MKGLYLVLLLAGLIALGVLSACQYGYQSPESVDTPALASLPRTEWPEHGLNAVKRGLSWGQCGVCGFPVTTEDVRNGFGASVGFFNKVYYETFVCYRHVEEVIENPPQIIEVEQDCKEQYQRGVNAALQSIMLHDLELSLKGERMTWGERADIVRVRLQVRKKGE